MTMRLLCGRHPATGETGFWIAKPGYDCVNDDRTDRTKFLFSSSFAGRRPFRTLASGQTASNTPIYLPGSLASLGGTPALVYRPMNNATQERQNNLYGTQNDGAGNAFAYTEFFNRFVDGNPAQFLILNSQTPSSTGFLLRYMVLLL
ncbi:MULTISPECIES: hypothetical protein [Methylobacterium]|jgi:hypothetical protein|uniref:Uncharacterized protein n=2 Tax=Pseudomonadota TaxID=1224 RepID=A0ABQ4SXQ3_9HYPH|nr:MULTISPECIES: hypothetical protein [Methylobacterium]PIU05291.1 MAG: hypothetical protein COT56_16010 [Methylobacterium sp. CG09_land_8_20_14_0_10_71_15]PIU12353.1 MAG: hypothetical protein COT28_15290 [Methylobacterium sp. CG08_land_8_20_14_0_20_71_15]GBU16862.1 hypothetical protein AwMethylo_10770 [Methylobacterium sp.]GJE07991.1 hypothetical protein AOPFMNJM_3323 [Methylobacterium jeotgali]